METDALLASNKPSVTYDGGGSPISRPLERTLSHEGRRPSMLDVTVGGSTDFGEHSRGGDAGRMFLHHGEINVRRRFDSLSIPLIYSCFSLHISIPNDFYLNLDYFSSSLYSLFHTLAYMKTVKCTCVLVGIYVGIMFFYGVLWTIIGKFEPECNLEIHSLIDGFLFSLEVSISLVFHI